MIQVGAAYGGEEEAQYGIPGKPPRVRSVDLKLTVGEKAGLEFRIVAGSTVKLTLSEGNPRKLQGTIKTHGTASTRWSFGRWAE